MWPSLESIAHHFTEDRVSFSHNSDFHTRYGQCVELTNVA